MFIHHRSFLWHRRIKGRVKEIGVEGKRILKKPKIHYNENFLFDEKDQERPDVRDGEMIFHGIVCGFRHSRCQWRDFDRCRIGDAGWKSSSVAVERLELQGSRTLEQQWQEWVVGGNENQASSTDFFFLWNSDQVVVQTKYGRSSEMKDGPRWKIRSPRTLCADYMVLVNINSPDKINNPVGQSKSNPRLTWVRGRGQTILFRWWWLQ